MYIWLTRVILAGHNMLAMDGKELKMLPARRSLILWQTNTSVWSSSHDICCLIMLSLVLFMLITVCCYRLSDSTSSVHVDLSQSDDGGDKLFLISDFVNSWHHLRK